LKVYPDLQAINLLSVFRNNCKLQETPENRSVSLGNRTKVILRIQYDWKWHKLAGKNSE
jgi:hypothetical protein